jgi:arginine:agmatine antiporter
MIIAFVGIFFVDFENTFKVSDISKHGLSSLGSMSSVLLWAFIGLESVTITSDKIKNPQRTIPLATIIGVLLTAAVYVCGAIVITAIIPHEELLVSKAPYVDAAQKIFGKYGSIAMIVTGIIGLVGSLNGWILIHGQVSQSAALEGLFPKYFAKTNKHGAPNGIICGSILMTLLFLLTYQSSLANHIHLLIGVSVLAMLLPYFYSVIAFCYIAFLKKKELSKIEKIFLPMIGLISIMYVFAAIVGTGEQMVYTMFIAFLISVPFYCCIKK